MENAADQAMVYGIDGGSVGARAFGGGTPEPERSDSGTRQHFSQLSFDDLFGAVEQEWHDQALCAQTDPEAFFPEKGGSTREAKRICQACGVRDECLEYALVNDERFGIWGGLSERERRRLKKRIS